MEKNPSKPADDNPTSETPRPRARRARAGRTASPANGTSAANDALATASNASTASTSFQGGPDLVRSQSMASEPKEHDIRMRAYHRFLERGGAHGRDFDDWLAAERELKGM